MELDKIAVTVRPRTPWEAIDLGFTMARAWFFPLWIIWLTVALPLYFLAALIFSDQPFWAIMIIWWFKPMYEPLLLFWMSRALFGDKVSVSSVLRQGFSIVWPQLISNLTWRRLNPSRSFNMPVSVLEKLKGKARRNRIKILGKGQQAGTWLTIVGVHFEVILEVACMLLIIIMLPEELRWLDLDNFLFNPGILGQWLQHIGNILAMSLIAPFYVAAGFGLYLTRRTELEAWDIEIAFRRLMGRKNTRQPTAPAMTLIIVFAGSLLMGGLSADLHAATINHAEAEKHIEAVLADEAFGKKKEVTYWKYIGDQDDESESESDLNWLVELILQILEGFTQGFAAFGKGLLLVLGGVLLAWLIYKALANRSLLMGRQSHQPTKRQRPATLFGLALDTDSLPEDITAECRDLLQQGKVRAALSLLYRGALVALLQHERLEIPDSATEGECLALVTTACPESQSDFFSRLTQVWIHNAYGHQAPSEQQVMAFCSEWETLFGGVLSNAD